MSISGQLDCVEMLRFFEDSMDLERASSKVNILYTLLPTLTNPPILFI